MAEYHFLVVDDSPTMRQLVSFGLKRIPKSKIEEAANGVDALKKLGTKTFDLIVLDINMPLMDGLKLLSIVRKDPKHKDVPIVIATTEGAEADREKGIELGANAYLAKPIQTQELLETVKRLLKI